MARANPPSDVVASPTPSAPSEATRREPLPALLALGGAGLAASCCLVPLALVSLGLGGVWVGSLTSLAGYQPWFLALATLALGWGFHRAYRRPAACRSDGACAGLAPRITRALLGLSTAIVLASATSAYWMPLLLD